MPREKQVPTKVDKHGSILDRRIGIVYDEKMAEHEDPVDPSHPEQPARISSIFSQLVRDGLLDSTKALNVDAPSVHDVDLLTVHTRAWLATCHECNESTLPELIFQSRRFDSVFLNEASLDCAKLSAGGTVELTKRVLRGECRHGAAIVRPPGHHAEAHCAKGFCFFNNVAVAAAVARREGCPRVLIVDWDVHHGNGTQHMFEDDPNVLYFSVHRHDRGQFYPGSGDGAASRIGVGSGKGFNVNVAWNTGGGPRTAGDADYLHAWEQVLIPIARQFQPTLTLISAGFDAARGDPLGGCDVTPQGYGHLTKQLMEVTPEGKVVLVLEGGYNLQSISTSFAECVRVLQAPTETVKATALARALKGKAKHADGDGAAFQEGGGGGGGYLPKAYPGPLLASKMATAAVRATVRRLEPFWKLRTSARNAKVSLGGGFSAGESSYATCPRVVSRFPGRQWALCFNAQHFTGRLTRFARVVRWKRAEFDFLAINESDDESIASSAGELNAEGMERSSDEEAAHMQQVLGQEDNSGESMTSESNGSSNSDEDDTEEGYWKGQMDGGRESESSSEGSEMSESSHDDDLSENTIKQKGKGNGKAFAFKFDAPPLAELVHSEDSFTPFAKAKAKKNGKKKRDGDFLGAMSEKGTKRVR